MSTSVIYLRWKAHIFRAERFSFFICICSMWKRLRKKPKLPLFTITSIVSMVSQHCSQVTIKDVSYLSSIRKPPHGFVSNYKSLLSLYLLLKNIYVCTFLFLFWETIYTFMYEIFLWVAHLELIFTHSNSKHDELIVYKWMYHH